MLDRIPKYLVKTIEPKSYTKGDIEPLVNKLLFLSLEASKNGILALDDILRDYFPPAHFPHAIFYLAICGTPTDRIYDIALNLIISRQCKGLDLYKMVIITKTAINILEERPYEVCLKDIFTFYGGVVC